MRRFLFVLALVSLVVFPASAKKSPGEYIFTGDGGYSLSSGWYTGGPSAVDVVSNGNASITFYWFLQTSRVTVVALAPVVDQAQGSEARYQLRSAFGARHFDVEYWGQSSGPDSMYVDCDGATEVIVTW